jgi:hypothetical protein
MNQLSREDFIELGVSIPMGSLIGWASGQLAATKGRETRLQARGVNAAYLTGVKDLVGILENRQKELGGSPESPLPSVALAQRIREEAVEYWREAKQMAVVQFGTSPDLLAKFRPGVRTGHLIANLTKELESIVGLFREHSTQLAPLGGTEAFIERGTLLIARLKEVKAGLDAACRALPPTAAQQGHDKGLLYDLTRKLVRTARLEFLPDPEQAAAFNFTGLRGKRGVSSRPGLKKEKVGGRERD